MHEPAGACLRGVFMYFEQFYLASAIAILSQPH
jgi:hypothetical protein